MGMWEIGDLCKNKTKKEGNLIDVFRENENIGIYVWEWESGVSVSAWDSERNINFRKPTLASAKIQPNIGKWQSDTFVGIICTIHVLAFITRLPLPIF
jgi:hypothetical protein